MNADWLHNDTVTVTRPTSTPDGYGGTTITYTTIGTFPCRVSPRLPRLSFTVPVSDEEQTQRAMRVVYLSYDADVQRNDVLLHGNDKLLVISTVVPSTPGAYKRADSVYTEAGN